MEAKGKHRLRRYIFVILLVSALLPVSTLGFWMIITNSERIEAVMQDDLTMLSENQIRSIESFCSNRKENMDMVAQISIVKEAIWASLNMKHKDVRYLDNLLEKQKNSKEFLKSISIVDRNFRVVSSTEMIIRSEKSELKNTKAKFLGGEFYISDVYERESEEGNIRVMLAVIGVFSGDKLIGYVVEEIAAEHFDSMRTSALVGEHGTVSLIDGKDDVISSGMAIAREGTSTGMTEELGEDFEEAWNGIDKENNPSGKFVYHNDGDKWVTYYSDINYTDWCVRINVNMGYYISQRDNYKVFIVIVLIGVLLLMVGVDFILIRKMFGPIQKIVDTLRRVQDEQDYSVRVNYVDNTELGYVANQVDKMLSYIEEESLKDREIRHSLEELADTDPLTGINNKRAFHSLLTASAHDIKKRGGRIAVGFVDIDNFRDFNTIYGHTIGDQVIRFVSSTLERLIHGEVGRNGGDEFAFYITDEEEIKKLRKTLDEYLDMMQAGIGLRERGTRVVVTCSIGVIIAKDDELDSEILLAKADEAMYVAKREGKNRYNIVES